MALENEKKVISDFLKSIGPWSDHIVIGGGYALFVYRLYLAPQANPPVGTSDIDSLIPRRMPAVCKKNIACHLREAGFKHVFKNMDIPATEAYVKVIDGFEIEVEFLTDAATRKDKDKNVLIAGVVAQPLSYLNLSLQMTLKFQTYSGERGLVVSPGAWIFHKGLTFVKRKSASKLHKDLYGIWYVATQLGEFSKTVVAEFGFLRKQYHKWFSTWQNNLLHWKKNASPDEWARFELQDPSGMLKRLHFEKTIETLLNSKFSL